jgi:hypothetical protein
MSFFAKIQRSHSIPRFDSYKPQGGGDEAALARYLWNIALCESLYPALQVLEVSFRNAVHDEIGKVVASSPSVQIGREWLRAGGAFLQQIEQSKIAEARESLLSRSKPVTEAFLVAEMSFGFWNSLLDVRYDQMWHKIIKGVFPNMPKADRTRAKISPKMNDVRKLRNAALHHHSIWHWADLAAKHNDALTLIHWICDASASMLNQIDRFPNTLTAGPGAFSKTASALARS